jgi:transposase
MSNRKKVVHSQGREIIYNVYNFMKEEVHGTPAIPFSRLQDRVAKATGVGLNTVKRIIKEAEQNGGTKFSSPRKTIVKPSPRSSVDEYEEEVVRNVIYNFTKTHNKRPTMKAVFEAVKNEDSMNFTGKIRSFRRLVHRLGFRWKKCHNNRQVLIEKTEIRAKRVEFLRKLKKYKNEGRNVVYSDETYLHSSHTVANCWSDGTNNCLKSPIGKGERLIILHAGGKKGFVPNALLMFKSGLTTGDYHDDMNHKNYVKWLKEKLLPNLERNSVLVVDNASYHNVCTEPNPTFAWKKAALQEWLSTRNLFFELNETKTELYTKIKLHKSTHKSYVIDKLLAEHGHVVLRLPPYHPELNPIEKIWALVKNYVAANNTLFTLKAVKKLAEDKFNIVTVQEWENICAHVDKKEQEFMDQEYIMDDIEEIIIRSDESDDSDSYLSSEDDSVEDDLGCQPL